MPDQGYAPPPGDKPKKTHKLRNFVVLPIIGLFVLLAIIGAISGGGKSKSKNAASISTSAANTPTAVVSKPPVATTRPVATKPPVATKSVMSTVAPAPVAPAPVTPSPVAPAPVAPQAPNYTPAQQQAIKSAQSYLSLSAFSRGGLIEQLSSDAGDGFSVQDATVAVDSLHTDYNAEAAKAAKAYLSLTSFSCSGLIEQLSSDAGDKYTLAQAQYGAKQTGIC